MTTSQQDPFGRRAQDQQTAVRIARWVRHTLKRENWYRDIWLFIISGILLWSVAIAQDNANQAKTLAVRIQQSRIDQCQRDNIHHSNTIAAFGNLTNQQKASAKNIYVNMFRSAGIKLTPHSERALQQFVINQLKSQSHGTIALINAIAPARSCTLKPPVKKKVSKTAATTRK